MNNASNWKPGAPDINNFVVLDIAVSHVTIRTRMNHFRALLFVGIALFLAFVLGMISKRSLTDIIDIHEHIESLAKAEEFLRAMDAEGIARAVLLPSPIETITLNGNKSFTGHEENMEEIFRIAKKYPNRFIPFCTISPLDADPLAILKSCVEKGGKGLKLYNGHSYYYDVFGAPLDTPSMMPVYAYAQQEGIPVIYHVNINRYGEELERVLSAYPDLRVLVPHFMISSVDITRVEYFFSRYPNLFTDIGFGREQFMAAAFRRIGADNEAYRKFFAKYRDRILFGPDMVLTEVPWKDARYMRRITRCYRDLLEKEMFRCGPIREYYEEKAADAREKYARCNPAEDETCLEKEKNALLFEKRFAETHILRGLALEEDILERVYAENAERFLQESSQGERR